MNKEPKYVLGIDIGGSHITAGLVDNTRKAVLPASVIRRKVNRYGSAEDILTTWTDTIREVDAGDSEYSGIGFAMPGPFDYERGICLIRGFDKYESLYNMNIRHELADRLSFDPADIVFRNDAEAFLEGELLSGSALGYNHAIGITLGTGLGSAKSHFGVTSDAALSTMIYEGEIIEERISTRGLLRTYRELTGKKLDNVLSIAELYHVNSNASETFRIFAHHLSWFLTRFIKQESPEVLVIGGNIAQSYGLFEKELLTQLNLSEVQLPKIVTSTLGEDALLIGGAAKAVMPS